MKEEKLTPIYLYTQSEKHKNKSKSFLINCSQCGEKVKKSLGDLKKTKMGRCFCSQSCAATYNNKLHPKRKKEGFCHVCKTPIHSNVKYCKECYNIHKQKPIHKELFTNKSISKKAKFKKEICIICSNQFEYLGYHKRKTCTRECYIKNLSKKMSERLKRNRSHIRGPHVQSYMESSFEKWLNENGYKRGFHGYLTEVHFFNPNTKKNGFIDFAFPKLKLCIELDGTHHLKRKELDNIRDDYLRTRNWNVVRISQKEYIKKTRINEISNLLKIKKCAEQESNLQPKDSNL